MSTGAYAKFIVGTASAVVTALTPYYGSTHWFPALTAGIGALLVYLVPNQSEAPRP